jgi:DNA-binding transcriptional regulator YhcF (GntR family)
VEHSFDADRPIYIQLKERVKRSIVTGEYAAGSQLPSVRELAEAVSVNPNTMQKALAELEREELLHSQRTSGRFVTEDIKMIEDLKMELAKEQVLSFLRGMAAIGVDAEQAVKLITEAREGE